MHRSKAGCEHKLRKLCRRLRIRVRIGGLGGRFAAEEEQQLPTCYTFPAPFRSCRPIGGKVSFNMDKGWLSWRKGTANSKFNLALGLVSQPWTGGMSADSRNTSMLNQRA
jgi:hypothetical protein